MDVALLILGSAVSVVFFATEAVSVVQFFLTIFSQRKDTE